eukprot:scaffold232543_cov30-Tisochrysis_lutea.AAC.1
MRQNRSSLLRKHWAMLRPPAKPALMLAHRRALASAAGIGFPRAVRMMVVAPPTMMALADTDVSTSFGPEATRIRTSGHICCCGAALPMPVPAPEPGNSQSSFRSERIRIAQPAVCEREPARQGRRPPGSAAPSCASLLARSTISEPPQTVPARSRATEGEREERDRESM